jgi:branched-chain amino acid transport system ATP-binding protein
MTEQPLLQVENLDKRFGGLIAVASASLEVHAGEIVGLIGPNGAGKTTLFNLITGVYRPTAGRVVFDGRDVTGLSPASRCKLGIARTFQLARPFPDMTVAQNLVVGCLYGNTGLRGVRMARAEAGRLLELIGLEHVAEQPAARLTLSQRKRLELGRALATRPTVLLLDEGMAGLNQAELREALDLLRRVRVELGLTLVIVEHMMEVIVNLCERVVVMNQGRKIAEGRPEAVAHQPQVVEAYLGPRAAAAMRR